ncbi:autotransporter outer membrane beta-barrel domain-containing protein [Ensifer sp. IC3342]|nr:autotransporter outer membrane beta-barrel domain-containing protein [Ensifer sp. BRP08]MCA1448654.1 autotransporter outer membrane beta-barrel domain-containing protein [Ensifer sp. IC3342]
MNMIAILMLCESKEPVGMPPGATYRATAAFAPMRRYFGTLGLAGKVSRISESAGFPIYGLGAIEANGYGFGGTLTWYGNGGLYVDGQAQATWYDSDLTSATLGRTLADGNDGFGYGLSIEAGQKITLRSNWSITPQAQLVYSSVRFSDFTDPFGARVSLDDGEFLIGRIGLSADYESEWRSATGGINRVHVYGIANLYYDFLGRMTTEVAGTRFTSGNEDLWGGIGVGGSLNWADDKYSVYGEATAKTSINDFGDSGTVSGTVGFRVRW